MAWVRALEKFSTRAPDQQYRYEFEIASESKIIGLLNYADGFLRSGPLTLEVDDNGMLRYLCHLSTTTFSEEDIHEWNSADEEGYSFPGGLAEEILALLSIFFRCRFYLVSTSQLEMDEKSMKLKNLNNFVYQKINSKIHPSIFHDQGLNWVEVSVFFDKIRNLPPVWHRRFALACLYYRKALKEIGVDEEMVFIYLVSAVECLMETASEMTNDPFKGVKLSEFCDFSKLDGAAVSAVQTWYGKTRHVKNRFLNFIKVYSTGYLPTPGTAWNKIDVANMGPYIEAIYDARSEYLHAGKPMYISRIWPRDFGDFDPSFGQIIDQRAWPASELLPYPHFFEGLVRHCILGFLEQKGISVL